MYMSFAGGQCNTIEKKILRRIGWFDPWALLTGFKRTASRLGAHFVNGEAISFEFELNRDIEVAGVDPGTYEALNKVMVKMENGEVRPIAFSQVVIAAGAHSGSVAKLGIEVNGTPTNCSSNRSILLQRK